MQPRHIIKSRVTNDRKYPVTLIIEPWADEYPMPPGLTYEIRFEGPAGTSIEFASRDQELIVWGSPGSTFSLYQDHRLLRECDIPAPPTAEILVGKRTVPPGGVAVWR